MSNETVSELQAQDLPSVGTIHARAFHEKNEWHRRVFPSSLAPWWEQRFARVINDPAYRSLKVTSAESPNTVVGLISLRKYEADERGAGTWDNTPSPPGGDAEGFKAVVQSMVKYREEFMFGQPHLCVDLLAVDTRYQGRALGTKLVARACEIADAERLPIFVQANEFAEGFYQKAGFETQSRVEMPGGMSECFLVRPAK